MIVVYSTPSCQQCNLTKKALDKLGLAYEELPLDDDIREQALAAGISSAPVVLVEGKMLWGGFRPDAIKRLAQLVDAA